MEDSQKQLLSEALDTIGSCDVIVSGESMKPFILPGDTVHIARSNRLRTGHVIAFFNDQQLIVHRILSRKKTGSDNWQYKVWGDSSPGSQGEITGGSVEGRVRYILRNGARHSFWFTYPFCLFALVLGFHFHAAVKLTSFLRKSIKIH
jgi:hypothetical protein